MMTKHIFRLPRVPLFLTALTALAGLASVTVHAQEPMKVATVDMQALFTDYFRTEEVKEQIGLERARVQEEDSTRVVVIKKLDEELQELRQQLEDTSLDDVKKKALFKDFQMKQQELMSLDRERREHLQRMSAALNEEMMRRMRVILEELRTIVEKQAKADGYSYVFDRSGLSTSQVPVLLYAKDAADITPVLLKVLKTDAPKDLAEDPAK